MSRKKIPPYGEVAEPFTVLLRREIFRLTEGGAGKFRLKIYDEASGVIVYDNQTDSTDGSSPDTVLGGGGVIQRRF